jgi:two-component system, NtrC family, sensor kinase
MKSYILTFLLLLVGYLGFTQTNKTDSLLKQVALTNEDTNRVILLTEVGRSYRFSKPDSILFYVDQAILLAQKINYPKGEALALNRKSFALREMGNLPKSLEAILKSLKIAEDNHYNYVKGSALMRIGQIYADLNDNPRALNYFKQAVQKLEPINNKFETAISYQAMGMVYEQMNQLDTALYYEQKALKYKFQELESEILRTLGNIEAQRGHTNLALAHYHEGIQVGLKKNEKRVTSFLYGNLAQLFRQIKQPDSSIFYAKKGLEYGLMASSKKGILLSSHLLSELYDSINTKEAFHYFKIATATKDSLWGAGNIQAIQSMIEREQEQQQEVEKTKLAYNNQLKQYALLACLAILLLVAFFFYRNNQKEKKAKNLLQEQKDKVESTLTELKTTQAQLIQKEKLASLGELTAGIAHEIQNPLNFVNNFSELSVDLVKDLKDEFKKQDKDEVYIDELFDDLSQNQEKINHHGKRASSIVKGMLEHSRASTGVKELTDINKLADEYLRLSYHGLRAKDKDFNADFTTEFDESLPKINVIPQDIGRVLLNLINNAFYAVNEKSKQNTEGVPFKPTVTISTQNIDYQIVIKIKDNGMGMPESVRTKVFQPFFTTKPTGQGTGLGLSLAYDIVTKGHGGTLEVVSTEGVGSEFIMCLNI